MKKIKLFVGLLLSHFFILFISTQGFSAENRLSEVERTRTIMEKWVETRRIISKEKQDWEVGKEILNERIELVQREIDSLREKFEKAEESIAEADKKRAELNDENENLKESATSLETMVTALERQTRLLLKKLPDPICERVKPLSQRIPDKPEETKLSLSERFQNVIGILNEVNKFNREITVTSEVRTLTDGSSAEVTALYIGIGQGYYVSGNSKVAGVGSASEEGWSWTEANAAAPQIAEAIAILKNEKVAAYVKLPVEIK